MTMRRLLRLLEAVCATSLLGACSTARANAATPAPCDVKADFNIPIRPLRFGATLAKLEGFAKQPEIRAVVRDSAEWLAVWNQWRPGSALPAFNFRDSVLAVATVSYASSPIDLRFVSVRCVRGELIASIQPLQSMRQQEMPERAIGAVAFARNFARTSSVKVNVLPVLVTR